MTEFRYKVEFENVRAVRKTPRALVVVIDDQEHLIPDSQIDDDSEVRKASDEGTLVISEWIAKEKGLI